MPIHLTADQFKRLKTPRQRKTIRISRVRTNKKGEIKELVVPESSILNACLQYLWTNGYYAFRVNSGEVITKWGSRVKLAPPGTADIIAITPTGRFLAVETKTAKGKQRDVQELFQQRIEDNHGIYILARSAHDLIEQLKLYN